jgi:hypothetical protein
MNNNESGCPLPVRVTEHEDGRRTVHYGAWSVGVDSDGILHTPSRVRPDAIDEFVGAVLMAASLGKQMRAPARPKPLPLQIQWPDDWWRR